MPASAKDIERMEGDGTGDENVNTPTISSGMSASAIIAVLTKRRCREITGQLDLNNCLHIPFERGGFGDIYKGTLNGGEKVAIKCARLYLREDNKKGRKTLKRAARELYYWSCFKHENVLELLGLARFHDQMAMISPWMDNGTLLQYIERNPTTDRYQLCADISEGVAYLHQSDAVHGDIKSANVLISSEGVAKLADFGCTELKKGTLRFTTTTNGSNFTMRWAAPEILKGTGIRSKEGDIYAVGMTLIEVITGVVPFNGKDDFSIWRAVVTNKQIPQRPKVFPSFTLDEADQLWEIVVSSCAHSALDRPGAAIVRNRLRDIRNPPEQPSVNQLTINPSSSTIESPAASPDRQGDEDGGEGEGEEGSVQHLSQPIPNGMPEADPYANAQPGTVAYAKSESRVGITTYTPVIALETVYKTPSGPIRGIKWVPATSSQVAAAGISIPLISANEDDKYRGYEERENDEDDDGGDRRSSSRSSLDKAPFADAYANARPGTIAYSKAEGPDGTPVYTPVIAQETFYMAPSGLIRDIKWVTATSSQALAAGIPSEPISTTNEAQLPKPKGMLISPMSSPSTPIPSSEPASSRYPYSSESSEDDYPIMRPGMTQREFEKAVKRWERARQKRARKEGRERRKTPRDRGLDRNPQDPHMDIAEHQDAAHLPPVSGTRKLGSLDSVSDSRYERQESVEPAASLKHIPSSPACAEWGSPDESPLTRPPGAHPTYFPAHNGDGGLPAPYIPYNASSMPLFSQSLRLTRPKSNFTNRQRSRT